MQWCINYKWLWTVITKTKILINLTTWFFSLFVVLIKIIQIFFQILVHCMIWCDDGLPKNSRAKLYSTSTTVSQTQFFSPFFFFILHSIHFWNREYLCVFGGVRKTRVFFGGKFNSDTLLPTTHWDLKKSQEMQFFITKNALVFILAKHIW